MPRPPVKRPLLPKEDRNRLRRLAEHAGRFTVEQNATRAYAKGVQDALNWLTGDDSTMTSLLEEVTR